MKNVEQKGLLYCHLVVKFSKQNTSSQMEILRRQQIDDTGVIFNVQWIMDSRCISISHFRTIDK